MRSFGKVPSVLDVWFMGFFCGFGEGHGRKRTCLYGWCWLPCTCQVQPRASLPLSAWSVLHTCMLDSWMPIDLRTTCSGVYMHERLCTVYTRGAGVEGTADRSVVCTPLRIDVISKLRAAGSRSSCRSSSTSLPKKGLFLKHGSLPFLEFKLGNEWLDLRKFDRGVHLIPVHKVCSRFWKTCL